MKNTFEKITISTTSVNGFDQRATIQWSSRVIQAIADKSRDLDGDEEICRILDELLFLLQTFNGN